jgi:hypothetical protein
MPLKPPSPSRLLQPPPGLPPRIRTDASNAFAHHTMAVRVPAILDEVLAGNPDLAPAQRARVAALRDALRAGAALPPVDPGSPHAEIWLPELAKRAHDGWLSSDWFCV